MLSPFFERIGYDGEGSQFTFIDLDIIYTGWCTVQFYLVIMTVHYLAYHIFSPNKYIFTFSHLADVFFQNDLLMKTIEAIKINKSKICEDDISIRV